MSIDKKEWKKPILTIMNVNMNTEANPAGTGTDGYMFDMYYYYGPS